MPGDYHERPSKFATLVYTDRACRGNIPALCIWNKRSTTGAAGFSVTAPTRLQRSRSRSSRRGLRVYSTLTNRRSSIESNAVFEVAESGIGAERIEAGPQQDAGVESLFIALVEPCHRLVVVAERRIDD